VTITDPAVVSRTPAIAENEYLVVDRFDDEAVLVAVRYPLNLEGQGDMAAFLLTNYTDAFNCITRNVGALPMETALQQWPALASQGVMLADLEQCLKGADRLVEAAHHRAAGPMAALINDVHYDFALGDSINCTDSELSALRRALEASHLSDQSDEDIAATKQRIRFLERQQLVNNGARLVDDLECTARRLRNALDSYASHGRLAQAQLLDLEFTSQSLVNDLLWPVKALLADLASSADAQHQEVAA